MLLVHAVVMMAQLMHEHMQQHKRLSLSLGKPTHDDIAIDAVVRKTQALKDRLMRVEIGHVNLHPKILRPGIKKNPAGFFAMVEPVTTVTSAIGRKDDTF